MLLKEQKPFLLRSFLTILLLIPIVVSAQFGGKVVPKSSVIESTVSYNFTLSEQRFDDKYYAARPSYKLAKYLTDSLGDFYPSSPIGEKRMKVKVTFNVSDIGLLSDFKFEVDSSKWYGLELALLKDVIRSMPQWNPSYKKNKEIESRMFLTLALYSSQTIIQEHVTSFCKNKLEVYEYFPDQNLVKKDVPIVIEKNGSIHFAQSFNKSLATNYPENTLNVLKQSLESLPPGAVHSVDEKRENVVTLSFKKVRNSSVSKEQLDTIRVIMNSEKALFKDVDEEAFYSEGETALNKYIQSKTVNVKKIVHPKYQKKGKKVYVRVAFVVKKSGKVSGAKVIKGKERLTPFGVSSVINAFNKMPKWNPAMKFDLPVNKRYFHDVVLEIQ